ncbi:unnamed protein product [Phyllotreta striolata]|uniref:Uncharacterized protein n=1 Tax=Phyllotreta striolata TaxID=444603 RepID=A0A9N9XJC2_PHYSR|nr:unnamed protein product [Phyllotreta striolata]
MRSNGQSYQLGTSLINILRQLPPSEIAFCVTRIENRGLFKTRLLRAKETQNLIETETSYYIRQQERPTEIRTNKEMKSLSF